MRTRLTHKYSWAIPSEEAITALLKYSPIIEVGAGTGYWASLVKQAGGDIVATDIAPPQIAWKTRANIYHPNGDQYIPGYEYIVATAVEAAAAFPERTLFTCWPEYDEAYVSNMLRAYTGDFVIYIGEGYGGCTGNDDFHYQLEEEWNLIDHIGIPTWPSVHDSMRIYLRK